MRELTQKTDAMKKQTELVIPYSFEKMISYLGYSTRRDVLYKEFIEFKNVKYQKASDQLEELLFLKMKEIQESGDSKKKLMDYRLKTTGKVGSLHMSSLNQLLKEIVSQGVEFDEDAIMSMLGPALASPTSTKT